jgi:hypothetical protein
MNQDNKEAGSDMKFLFWDDPGDSQENVDNQATTRTAVVLSESGSRAATRDTDEEERKAEERMRIILQNGNTGEHYPEYQDYTDDTDEE